MHRYLVRRLILIVPVLFGVSVAVFLILHLTPGDPAKLMLGINATEETVATLRRDLHLDEPLHQQYFRWLAGILRGDMGRSLWSSRPVADEIAGRFRATLLLAGTSLVLSAIPGLLIGTISAAWKYSMVDKLVMFGAVVGVSMPSFWVGLVLLVVFSLKLGWFPISGMHSPTGGGVADLLHHLVLPAVSLALPNIAIVARLMRSSLLEVLGQDYIRTAASKGLRESVVLHRHAFKNALIPVLTVIGVQVGVLLSGSIVVETVFAWPGLGTLALAAILSRDIPLVQGITLFVAVIFVVVNLIIDLAYAYVDPRIRYG